jgi:hypothetical protein
MILARAIQSCLKLRQFPPKMLVKKSIKYSIIASSMMQLKDMRYLIKSLAALKSTKKRFQGQIFCFPKAKTRIKKC